MSQYKFQLNLFSLTDSEGMSRRLETMAQKGWLPVRVGPYVWRYRREEPKNLRYHVAYFPRESVYDPEESEEKRTYRQACEETGWQYVSGYESLQIFSAEDPNAVPPEIDAAMRLEAIDRCFKKRERFLWLYTAAFALLVFILALITYTNDPVEILSDGAWQLGALAVLVIALMSAFEAVRYGRWLKKAWRQVGEDGSFSGLKSLLPWEIAAVVLALVLFGCRLWVQDAYSRLVSIADLLSLVIVFAAAAITRRIKRKENSERRTAFVTTVTVVLLVALVMGMAQDFVLKNFRPQLEESDMLLSICELTGESSESVYRSEEMQKSLLLEDLTQYQAINNQTEGAPIMQYRITKIKNPKLTEKCQESCLPARLHDKVPAEDAAPWGAEQLWVSRSGSSRTVYYLYYADRAVTLMVNWNLTDDQIEALSSMFQSV